MDDLSFPLDKPLSPLEMKRRLLRLNGKLYAVRKWKDPQADKAIHLLVKDNIGRQPFIKRFGASRCFLHSKTAPESQNRNLRQNPSHGIGRLCDFQCASVWLFRVRRFRSKSPWKLSLRGFKRRICHCRRSRFLRCSPWH